MSSFNRKKREAFHKSRNCKFLSICSFRFKKWFLTFYNQIWKIYIFQFCSFRFKKWFLTFLNQIWKIYIFQFPKGGGGDTYPDHNPGESSSLKCTHFTCTQLITTQVSHHYWSALTSHTPNWSQHMWVIITKVHSLHMCPTDHIIYVNNMYPPPF